MNPGRPLARRHECRMQIDCKETPRFPARSRSEPGFSRISWSRTTHDFRPEPEAARRLGEGPAWTRSRINTIRTLAMDAVQQANSGHPGTPMALAPVAYCLWQNHLRYDPEDPVWPNRDRFVLSAGHASMLLYSLLAPDRRQGGQQGLRDRWASRPSRWTTSRSSGSCTASARATRNTA